MKTVSSRGWIRWRQHDRMFWSRALTLNEKQKLILTAEILKKKKHCIIRQEEFCTFFRPSGNIFGSSLSRLGLTEHKRFSKSFDNANLVAYWHIFIWRHICSWTERWSKENKSSAFGINTKYFALKSHINESIYLTSSSINKCCAWEEIYVLKRSKFY